MKKKLLIIALEATNNKLLIDLAKKKSTKYHIVIATYDIQIFTNLSQCLYIDRVVFFDKPITIYDVANKVNTSIKSANSIISKYICKSGLLHFQQHVEGGHTSQKVQDALIIEKSLQAHTFEHQTNEILLIDSASFPTENAVIKSFATLHKLKLTIVRINATHYIFAYLKQKLKRFLYEPYRFVEYLLISLSKSRQTAISSENSLVFALNSDAVKFQEMYNSFFSQLSEQSRTKVFFLTYCIHQNRIQNVEIRNRIIRLEGYISPIAAIKSFLLSLLYLLRFMINYAKIKQEITQSMGEVISPVVMSALLSHIVIDTGFRYRHEQGLDKFLLKNKNKILAFKLWGATSLIQGEQAQSLISARFKNIRTLGFEVGIGLKNFPYLPNSINSINYILTSCPSETDLYRHYGINELRVFEIRKFKNPGFVSDFKARTNRESSMQTLGISREYKHYVLVDISTGYMGYTHNFEMALLVSNLPEWARSHPDVAFIVKPHPSFKETSFLKKRFGTVNNLLLFGKGLSILHFLNVADVILTKFSAIGTEGMLFGKLVVSLLLDRDDRWKAYDDAAVYIYDLNELPPILSNLSSIKAEKKIAIDRFVATQENSDHSITPDDFVSMLISTKDKELHSP